MRKLFAALALATAVIGGQAAIAQEGPVKIALLHGLSGSPLEVYSKQTQVGFEMGLEYATAGSTSRIFSYSAAIGSIAVVTPEEVAPTAISASSSP